MIVFPQDSMRSDLERLWRVCFGDSDEYIRYFFENRYIPENCLVYVDESGWMYNRGILVTCRDAAVLPALVLDLDSLEYEYAGACTIGVP